MFIQAVFIALDLAKPGDTPFTRAIHPQAAAFWSANNGLAGYEENIH